MIINDFEKKRIIKKQNLSYRVLVKKNNKNIFKSIIKEIKTLSKKIYWKSLFFLFYNIKSFAFIFSFRKVVKNKISILIPTRQRVLKFERFINSIISNTANLNRCELVVLIDTDDPERIEYIKLLENLKKKIEVKVFYENFKTHAKRNNFLASQCLGEIIFPANDDMIFVTKEWDNLLDVEFAKNLKNDPFCVWVDSGNKYPYLFCHFPIINRQWYKRLGYVGSELFNFWYLDTWICDLAKRSGKFIYGKKIKFKEYNAQANLEEMDITYLRNISNNKMEKDIEIWKNSVSQRIEEAQKLKNNL